MQWFYIVGIVILTIVAFIIGFVVAMVHCDKKIQDKKVMGELYITKPELEPYLVVKTPMEEVAKETYILLEVRPVNTTQK